MGHAVISDHAGLREMVSLAASAPQTDTVLTGLYRRCDRQTSAWCFGFGFGMEGSPSRLNCFAKNLSHRTVLSSVNMQSLKSSLCTNMSVQKKSSFSLFSARII